MARARSDTVQSALRHGDMVSMTLTDRAGGYGWRCSCGHTEDVTYLYRWHAAAAWIDHLSTDHPESTSMGEPVTIIENVALRCSFCGHWEKGQRTKEQIAQWLRVHRAASLGPYSGDRELASTCPRPCHTLPLADPGVDRDA